MPMETLISEPPRHPAATEPQWVQVVKDQVSTLQYGVVQIVVHDSHVIQIEKTERLRFGRPRQQSV